MVDSIKLLKAAIAIEVRTRTYVYTRKTEGHHVIKAKPNPPNRCYARSLPLPKSLPVRRTNSEYANNQNDYAS